MKATSSCSMLTGDCSPDFTKGNGLVAAIAQDDATGDVLMLAWMNAEAFEKTMQTGEAHYYSRSRQSLWHKGATSGHIQRVKAVRIDCDRDAVLLLVEQIGGAACHEGYRSCFFREVQADGKVTLCAQKLFDPNKVYES